MRKLLFWCLLIAGSQAFAQGGSYTNVAQVQGPGNVVRIIPSAPVVVCNFPGTGGTPCTNLATTYTDKTLGTACGSTVQAVVPGTNTCSANADLAGNFGFYVAAGTYVYYFQATSGWKGPFTVVMGPTAKAGTGIYIGTTNLSNGGVTGNCVNWQAGGVLGDANGPCGGGGGGGGVSLTPAGGTNQNIVQQPNTDFSATLFGNIRYVTPAWNWLQTDVAGSIGDLSAAGSGKTLTLTPCPIGIDTSASTHYTYRAYISGVGTPEAVPVTGGTCASGGASGTIIVTTINNHAAGFSVGSANDGWQEAWNDAVSSDAVNATWPYVKGMANVSYNFHSPLFMRGRGGIADFTGSFQNSFTRDRMLYIGTTNGSPAVNHHQVTGLSVFGQLAIDGVLVSSVTAAAGTYTVTTASAHPFSMTANGGLPDVVDCEYYGVNGSQHWTSPVTSVADNTHFTIHFGAANLSSGTLFGWCALLNTAVENNSDHVIMRNTSIIGFGNAFTFGVVNDNDQAFVVDGFTNRANNEFVASANYPTGGAIYERADQGNAGITYVIHAEITNANCFSAGGNGAVFKDSVCQGFPVYGMRYFGGLQPLTWDSVYEESTGGTTNPLYGASGQMGLLSSETSVHGTFPINGISPVFASGGATQRTYWVVPTCSSVGVGPVLFIGSAQPLNGGIQVSLKWPSPDLSGCGTLTWDVLVSTGTSASSVPVGTGNFALATGIGGSCGSNGMCSFTDTQAAPNSYTVASQIYYPGFWFWPVDGVILTKTAWTMDEVGTSPRMIAAQGIKGVSINALHCNSSGAPWQRSPIWINCLSGPNDGGAGSWANVMQHTDQSNNGPAANSRGQLNFGPEIGAFPNHIITLRATNQLTDLSIAGQRGTNDNNDAFIGIDQSGGNSFGARVSQSFYIGNNGDNASFLERLTSALHTFKVPITTNSQITSTLTTGTAPLVIASTTSVANLTVSNHPTLQDCGATTTCANTQKTAALLVIGRVSFPTATTVVITSLPFNSATSYTCTAQDVTTAAGVINATTYTSGASVTFTETGGVNTDAMRYQCSGF